MKGKKDRKGRGRKSRYKKKRQEKEETGNEEGERANAKVKEETRMGDKRKNRKCERKKRWEIGKRVKEGNQVKGIRACGCKQARMWIYATPISTHVHINIHIYKYGNLPLL